MKALLFVSILWAFSFGLIKGQLTGIDPSLVAAIRLLLCAVIFLPFIKFSTDNRFSLKLLALGALQFGVMYWAYIQSYQYLPAYLVAVLTIFTPIYVYLIACFIEKKFNYQVLLPVIGSIIGAAVIVYQSPNSSEWITGFFILQIANLAFATGQIGYKYLAASSKSTHTNNMAIMYIGAAIFSLTVMIINQAYVGIPDISQQQWTTLFYLGIVASGVGFALWNLGAKQVTPQTLAVMNNGYIPFAVLFSLTLFGEQADLKRLLIGTTIMLLSLWWLERKTKEETCG